MTHLVESMAYVGQTPWHGLGNQLGQKQPLAVWAKQAGMDWQIKETPVRFEAQRPGAAETICTFPEQKVLYRSDTNAALSVVSARYQVVQPREILEFYRDLTEISGYELETAGVLKGGKKTWGLARTGQSATLKGNDRVDGYLLLATACDGTLATTAQFTSVRVVCNNTLAVSLANGPCGVKVPHSTSFDAQAVKRQLGLSVSAWDGFMYRMKTLSERRLKYSEVEYLLKCIFADTSQPWSPHGNDRTINRVLALYEGNGKGASLASSAGTAFGLLNAVTQFVDHERRARNIDYRLDSAWFGQGAALKQKALGHVMRAIA